MKGGGNSYSFRGRHLSLVLVALVLLTTLLWTWEKNPIGITLQSGRDWYCIPSVYSVVRWLDSQLVSHPRLKVFFRTLSPRHFVNGDWNSGGSCDNIIPSSGGSEAVQEGSSDLTVEGALKGTKIKILDITAISQLRDEAHMSRYNSRGISNSSDCLHWCLHGIPDTWNELLVAQTQALSQFRHLSPSSQSPPNPSRGNKTHTKDEEEKTWAQADKCKNAWGSESVYSLWSRKTKYYFLSMYFYVYFLTE